MQIAGKFGLSTALAIVIANMIGTGVFTSLGFQLVDIRSPFVIMLLWAVGGAIALCGALCYAELGARLPRSGGEYNFLGQIYHPAAGFMSGLVSATVGFAAPTALAAMTFGTYLAAVFPTLNPVVLATILVVVMTVIHGTSHKNSAGFQDFFTAAKIILILGFAVSALILVPDFQAISFAPMDGDGELITGGAFAVSLIYVSYAYSGWNAATYLTGEMENPQRSLPIVLAVGTMVVAVAYLLLNGVFMAVAPLSAMAGQVEIGYIASRFAFGGVGAAVMGVTLSLLLISTVSAMLVAAPRVYQVAGEDYRLFSYLARKNKNSIPSTAIYLQGALTLIFLWSATFESILVFFGAIMALNTLFAVVGLFILRHRQQGQPSSFTVPFYPLPPLIFIGLTGWTLFYLASNRPEELWFALSMVVLATLIYWVAARVGKRKSVE